MGDPNDGNIRILDRHRKGEEVGVSFQFGRRTFTKRMRLPEDIGEAAVYLALQTPETLTAGLVSAPDYDQDHGIQRATAYERLHTL